MLIWFMDFMRQKILEIPNFVLFFLDHIISILDTADLLLVHSFCIISNKRLSDEFGNNYFLSLFLKNLSLFVIII
jgi:hypothetical protein